MNNPFVVLWLVVDAVAIIALVRLLSRSWRLPTAHPGRAGDQPVFVKARQSKEPAHA